MKDASTLFRHGMEAIFNPFFILLALLAVLIIWLWKYGDSWMVRGGLLFVLIGLVLLSTNWFPQTMTHKLQRQYLAGNEINPNIHWIVVFGGGQLRHVDAPVNHLLNPTTTQRLLEGVRLYRQLPASKLILSGGGERDETKSEAAHMATLASWFSIPEKNLVLESRSVNTADEAIAIKQWVHQEPFYLVTSSIHMPRAMALCRKQGLNPVAAPADYPCAKTTDWEKTMLPHPINLLNANVAWHEILGWVWGRVTGKI